MQPDNSHPFSGEPPTPPAPARWFTRGSHAVRSPTPEPPTAENEPEAHPEPTEEARSEQPEEPHPSSVAVPAEEVEAKGPSEPAVSEKATPAKRTTAKRTAPGKTTARAPVGRRSRRQPPGGTPPSAR